MQTIHRTAPSSNFTIFANDLINSSIPPTPQKILLYLLSKPETWQVKTHDIQKQLSLSTYAVKQGLRWLLKAGYAAYIRLKSGHTIWKIFDKPQVAHSPAISPQVEFPQVEILPVLVRTETAINTETTTLPTMPEPVPAQENDDDVVVSVSELIFPSQLNPSQKKAAKHVIKKIEAPELRQEVLFALAYAMTNGMVKSPVAYLQGLVKRANEGTFESIRESTGANRSKPIIPIWQGFEKFTPSTPEKAKEFIQQARSAIRGALC